MTMKSPPSLTLLVSAAGVVSLLVAVSCSPPAQQTETAATEEALAIAQPAAGTAGGTPRIDIVGTQQKIYSQQREELIIRDFFQDRREGFFLDVGCALPKHNSTTYLLENHLGWRGIGVDALAEYGDKWKRWRPASTFLNFLVTDHSDTEDVFYRAGWTEVSSAKKAMVEEKGVPYKEIKVMTATLDRILETHKVENLDFLSLDIEGAQLEALAGFSIEKHRPKLVCIEAYVPHRAKFLEYFESHGYQRIDRYLKYDQVNWYFTPKS